VTLKFDDVPLETAVRLGDGRSAALRVVRRTNVLLCHHRRGRQAPDRRAGPISAQRPNVLGVFGGVRRADPPERAACPLPSAPPAK